MTTSHEADRQHGEAAEPDHSVELRKEAYTMALYVAICLLAALVAIPEGGEAHARVLGIVWGVTVGLALAHWFAFRVSSRLVGAGTVRAHDLEAAGAQLGGAVVVAVIATVPVLLFSDDLELRLAVYVLAGFISRVGYAVARGAGAGRPRAVVYAALVLAVGLAIAVLKNVLAGH